MNILFESVLQEADKSRFIKKLWTDAGCDGIGNWNEFSLEDTINFFNTHTNISIDWQSKDTTIKTLWDIMHDNYESKAKKEFKGKNARKAFESRTDCKVIAENDEFIFVAPLCYEAAVFMDSFQCGGAGAKWCIGYEKTSAYWHDYNNHACFVLAFNKNPLGEQDVKYMIQMDIEPGETKAWRQNDDPCDTIAPKAFPRMFGGMTEPELRKLCKSNVSTSCLSEKDEIRLDHSSYGEINNSPTVTLYLSDKAAIKFSICIFIEHCKNTLRQLIIKDSNLRFFTNSWDDDDTKGVNCKVVVDNCKINTYMQYDVSHDIEFINNSRVDRMLCINADSTPKSAYFMHAGFDETSYVDHVVPLPFGRTHNLKSVLNADEFVSFTDYGSGHKAVDCSTVENLNTIRIDEITEIYDPKKPCVLSLWNLEAGSLIIDYDKLFGANTLSIELAHCNINNLIFKGKKLINVEMVGNRTLNNHIGKIYVDTALKDNLRKVTQSVLDVTSDDNIKVVDTN